MSNQTQPQREYLWKFGTIISLFAFLVAMVPATESIVRFTSSKKEPNIYSQISTVDFSVSSQFKSAIDLLKKPDRTKEEEDKATETIALFDSVCCYSVVTISNTGKTKAAATVLNLTDPAFGHITDLDGNQLKEIEKPMQTIDVGDIANGQGRILHLYFTRDDSLGASVARLDCEGDSLIIPTDLQVGTYLMTWNSTMGIALTLFAGCLMGGVLILWASYVAKRIW